MKSATTVVLALVFLTPLAVRGQEYSGTQEADDPYGWLEDVEGEDALAWVTAHNERTLAALQAIPAFDSIYRKNLEIYRSDARIITPEFRGEYVYELWQDEQHERGLWRRMLFESYLASRPDWETLLDVDSLAKAENEAWVYASAGCLPPENIRCLVRLTRGGSDAAVLREFDLSAKAFVESGFLLPEALTYYVWKDANTLWVATDFGEGTTTRYGRPRIVKAWRRGLPLDQAEVLFEGDSTDLLVFPVVEHSRSRSYYLIAQLVTRSKTNVFAMEDGRLIKLDIPLDAYSRIHPAEAQLVLLLKSDWLVGDTTYPQGALLSIDYDDFLAGDRTFEAVFEPDDRSYVFSMDATKNSLLVNVLRNARSELYQYRREGGRWIPEHVSAPDHATTYYTGLDRDSDRFFYKFEGFLTPRTLSLSLDDGTIVDIESEPLFFDAESLVVNQHETTSRDGTRVPYFIVHHRNMELDGHNPTLLYSYGGFGTPMVPYYEPVVGTAWLARGGVYVLANIRGGGEFGPRWHRAALRENRQRAYDDFIAVAEDLMARGITSPRHLGIMGRSNGGLLVGAVFTQRPDLFNAVACLHPVLDLRRAEVSEEIGDPNNPDDWAYMKKYSPYHNVWREKAYPRVFLVTSRTDDRVPPGHARKMAAKMEAMGHAVYFYELEEGGHVGGVTTEQEAFRDALIYSYLLEQLR